MSEISMQKAADRGQNRFHDAPDDAGPFALNRVDPGHDNIDQEQNIEKIEYNIKQANDQPHVQDSFASE